MLDRKKGGLTQHIKIFHLATWQRLIIVRVHNTPTNDCAIRKNQDAKGLRPVRDEPLTKESKEEAEPQRHSNGDAAIENAVRQNSHRHLEEDGPSTEAYGHTDP